MCNLLSFLLCFSGHVKKIVLFQQVIQLKYMEERILFYDEEFFPAKSRGNCKSVILQKEKGSLQDEIEWPEKVK